MQDNQSEVTGTNQLAQMPPLVTGEDKVKILLHQYDTIVNLYKHNMDLTIKVNIFIYAVTGSILSFYLSKQSIGLMRYALIFPSIMNFGYAFFFYQASKKVTPFHIDLIAINKALGLLSFPDITILQRTLELSSLLFLLISVGLSLITVFN